MIKILLFCFTSLAIGSSLNDWIENKSKLIKNNDFKVSFNYTFKDKKKRNQENIYQNIEYYSINQNKQVLKIDNRYILFHPDYSEVIDEMSKQKFLEKKDVDLEKMRDKLGKKRGKKPESKKIWEKLNKEQTEILKNKIVELRKSKATVKKIREAVAKQLEEWGITS